jgi:hypothetical protein
VDRAHSFVFFAVCAALATAGPALAQDDPQVYIVSVAMDPSLEAVATRTGSAARAALRTIPGVTWREADQRFLGYDGSALNLLERARERLGAGRQHYLNLELDQAITELQGAVEDFDAAAAALEDPNDLGQALLFLGASHAFNMQRRQALAVFRRLHTQMPHISPDPNTFNPDVVQLYEQAAPPDRRNPAGSIEITSDPPGAIAYVDFLARGATPMTVDRLTAGEHMVRVSRPGATPFVESVNVRRGARSSSSAYLSDRDDLQGLQDAVSQIAAADVDSLGADNPIRAVGTMLALTKIGVIRVSGDPAGSVTLELLLFDVESGRRLVRGSGSVPTGIGQLEEGVQRLVSGAFEAALRPTQASDTEGNNGGNGGGGEQRPMIGAEPPLLEQWWFWTAIGAGVVVVAAAIAIGVVFGTQGALADDRGGQVIFTF